MSLTNQMSGVLALVLTAIILYGCLMDDPGHQTTAECSRQGKPSYHTPAGQRCYDK